MGAGKGLWGPWPCRIRILQDTGKRHQHPTDYSLQKDVISCPGRKSSLPIGFVNTEIAVKSSGAIAPESVRDVQRWLALPRNGRKLTCTPANGLSDQGPSCSVNLSDLSHRVLSCL